jgi:hypothetical protein
MVCLAVVVSGEVEQLAANLQRQRESSVNSPNP